MVGSLGVFAFAVWVVKAHKTVYKLAVEFDLDDLATSGMTWP